MSEVASILNGYHFRANSQYLQNTNLEFFEWHYDNANDQEIDYQRAMTFAHYLQEQYGERYLYELTGSPEANMARITDALRRYGMPEGYDYKEVLKGFAVANYLQTSSNHAWGYQYRLSSSSARPHLSYTGPSFPASGSASVNSYGTYYVQYTSPGAMRFRISGSGDIRTMLIGIRASDTTVVELEPNTDYTLPVWEGGAYSRMAIAFVNTGGGLREVNWTAEALTSAADLETGATGRFDVQSVVSNDADRTTIAYAVPVAGAVRLELFDVNGTRVATLVDDVRSAGAHRHALDVSGLASGAYVARLVQGGATASAMVFVTR
jgi:hypothetical protein